MPFSSSLLYILYNDQRRSATGTAKSTNSRLRGNHDSCTAFCATESLGTPRHRTSGTAYSYFVATVRLQFINVRPAGLPFLHSVRKIDLITVSTCASFFLRFSSLKLLSLACFKLQTSLRIPNQKSYSYYRCSMWTTLFFFPCSFFLSLSSLASFFFFSFVLSLFQSYSCV